MCQEKLIIVSILPTGCGSGRWIWVVCMQAAAGGRGRAGGGKSNSSGSCTPYVLQVHVAATTGLQLVQGQCACAPRTLMWLPYRGSLTRAVLEPVTPATSHWAQALDTFTSADCGRGADRNAGLR